MMCCSCGTCAFLTLFFSSVVLTTVVICYYEGANLQNFLRELFDSVNANTNFDEYPEYSIVTSAAVIMQRNPDFLLDEEFTTKLMAFFKMVAESIRLVINEQGLEILPQPMESTSTSTSTLTSASMLTSSTVRKKSRPKVKYPSTFMTNL